MFFKKLSGYHLKYFALFTMLLDHIGLLFHALLPEIISVSFRMAGRLSFPLFCFLLSEGFFYSRDRDKYKKRLFLFALLSEIPFDLAFHSLSSLDEILAEQNVFFTLFFGFLAMEQLEKWEKAGGFPQKLGVFIFFSCLNEIFRADYGAAGILCILLFYSFRKKSTFLSFSSIMISLLPLAVTAFLSFPLQLCSLFALVPILCYNGQKGQGNRYFFYLFYPVHLLFLAWLSWFLH